MKKTINSLWVLLLFIPAYGLLMAQEHLNEIPKGQALARMLDDPEGMISRGEFSRAEALIRDVLQKEPLLELKVKEHLQRCLSDIQGIKREYTMTRADVFKQLKAEISGLTNEDLNQWEDDYSLEYYLIDGVKKYYQYCISDLFKVNEEAARLAKVKKPAHYDASPYPLETINAAEQGHPLSKTITVSFSFFEDKSSLPDHSLIRAWIPFARENAYQSKIEILKASESQIMLPAQSALVAMIYFEHRLSRPYPSNALWQEYFKEPTPNWIFPFKDKSSLVDSRFISQFIFQYQSKARYEVVDPQQVKPFLATDAKLQKYTRETEAIRFTPFLLNLVRDITGSETNPYLMGKKIYHWVCQNIVWTTSKPVWGDHAEYTARYRRGDCGEKANLFMSLCRIAQIPTRIQGGWRIEPKRAHSDHSWAQVYFAPWGWLPVDVDGGSHLIRERDERLKFFYFGNRTPYRLIIYDDDDPLFPEKNFECTTGGGTQLGAFEWSGGDIEPNIKVDTKVE